MAKDTIKVFKPKECFKCEKNISHTEKDCGYLCSTIHKYTKEEVAVMLCEKCHKKWLM